ncbi:hypothetical protein CIHG_09595 [Coccidioides immitis H538.4]|uniref:Uncharacterized protein n=1 Tax=Coccidioides immitis H538.4 TaxID=396776 RepID=A0A0J8S350_COCIT|nr:hypothetical protein CIHG_09595 [Coccidioides immitis H538.4]
MPPSSEVYTSPSPTPDNKQNQEPPLSGVGGPGSKEPAAPSVRTSPTGLLSPEDGEKDTNLFNGAMDESKPTMEDNVSSGDTMKMEPEDKPSGSHPERSSEENMRPPTQPMERLLLKLRTPLSQLQPTPIKTSPMFLEMVTQLRLVGKKVIRKGKAGNARVRSRRFRA